MKYEKKKSFKEKTYQEVIPLRIFVFIFCFIGFFTIQAMAAQQGQMFWEIIRSGTTSSYLIGTDHQAICVNSLPPELNAALEKSRMGLIELSSSEYTEQHHVNAIKNQVKFPLGQDLSSYMNEEDIRKVFNFIQSDLTEHDGDGTLVEAWKESRDMDVTSYEDFKRSKPIMIQGFIVTLQLYISLGETQRQNFLEQFNGVFPEEEKGEECILQENQIMEFYLEKRLSCAGKSVHSIETRKDQISDMLSAVDHDFEAKKLIFLVDQLIDERQRRLNMTSEVNALFDEWAQLIAQIEMDLLNSFSNNYHKGTEVNTSEIQQTIVGFLTEKKCASLPEFSVSRYERQIILFTRQYIQYGSSGTQIDEVTEQEFSRFIKEIGTLKKDIFSSCFPDYIWPDNIEEIIEKRAQFALLNIKQDMKAIFLSRDKKQALRMIPFLENGGVFAVIGYGHLNGVIGELRGYGWEVRPIEFSRPLEEKATCLSDLSASDKEASDGE